RCDVSYSQICSAQRKPYSLHLKSCYVYLQHIEVALDNLKHQFSMNFEHTDQLTIRYVMFGVIESLHLTLLHLIENKEEKSSTEESLEQPIEVN
ncbi:hypothetical protein PMAYCL1PPCAC_13943, partial [Pristionchus mayeri]